MSDHCGPLIEVLGSGQVHHAPTEDQVLIAEQPNAWHRQLGESGRWYARFGAFRRLGPGRSLLATYNAEREKAGKGGTKRRTPGAWDRAAARWRWRERAESWDDALRKATDLVDVEVRAAERIARVGTGTVLRDAAMAYLAECDPATLTVREVIGLLRLGEELIAKGLGLDQDVKVLSREAIHVKVIDLRDGREG